MCRAEANENETIIECLRQYGEAFGQVINKPKSSIIFGTKVHGTTKYEINVPLKSIKKVEMEHF